MTVKIIDLLTRSQKAQQLGISYRTLTRWIDSNQIKYVQIKGSKKKLFYKTYGQNK